MADTPILSVLIDANRPGGARCQLRSADAADISSTRLALAAGDIYTLRAIWRTFAASDTGAVWTWAAGVAIDAVMTVESSLADEVPTEAANVASFAAGSADEDGNIPYDGALDLSGEGVGAAIGAAKSVMVVLDVRVTVGTTRITYRLFCELFRAADGGYLTPSGTTEMTNHANAQIRQTASGQFQFWDFTREAWVVPVLRDGVLEYVEVE